MNKGELISAAAEATGLAKGDVEKARRLQGRLLKEFLEPFVKKFTLELKESEYNYVMHN